MTVVHRREGELVSAGEILLAGGLPTEAVPEASTKTFPDGADMRIEIPSVEGPGVLAAVLDEAEKRDVVINRVSQGSGAMLQSEAELKQMSSIAAGAGLEVSLFIGPREEWGLGAMSRGPEGAALAGAVRGMRQLRYAVEDVLRAVDCGIRGFLVADLGLLRLLNEAQRDGRIPAEVVWKVSVMLAPSNPATTALLEDLGAGTINLPADLTLAELAEMRAVCDLPLDLYVEAPDYLGGVVRGEQLADLVAVTSPLYAKFGLRNSRGIYPSGMHLQHEAELIGREKVRRAQIALEWAARGDRALRQSRPGAAGLAVPVS
jgi:Peptidase family U32